MGSGPAFRDLFASSIALSSGEGLSTQTLAERVAVDLVSGNYFRVLGVSAQIGRVISDDDLRPVAQPVAVLSDLAWRVRIGGRHEVVVSRFA